MASGVVVGEYSLDFKSYPSLTGQLTDAQQEGLQQLLLAEQRVGGWVGALCVCLRVCVCVCVGGWVGMGWHGVWLAW